MNADVSDLLRLASDFDAASKRANVEAKAMVGRIAETTAEAAKAHAPVLVDREKAPNQRPGELRDSIDVRMYGVSGLAGFRAVVRANAYWASAAEYGTARSRPQPYMEPSRELAERGLGREADKLPDRLL